ncbi:MAG: ABC transporter ATP-binding protein [Lachnospiraceae bacterium]|nr:ABC transporter ATP-binding protein [Lachnospiraceae bacterium]
MWIIEIVKKISIILDKKQKRYVIILVALMFIGAVLEMLGVSLIIPLISAVIETNFLEKDGYIQDISELLGIETQRDFLIIVMLLLIMFYIVKNVFLFVQYYVQAKYICDNKLVTKTRLLKCYLNKPYEYYFNANSGEILREISTDATNTYNIFSQVLLLFTELIVVVALIITVFIIDIMLAVVFVVVLIVEMAVIYAFIKPVLRKAGERWTSATAISNKCILQIIDGIKEIKVSQKELYFTQEYMQSAKIASDSEKVNTAVSNVPRLLIESITITVMLVLMIFLCLSGRDITRLIPQFSAFVIAAVRLLPSVNRISASINVITYNKPALDNLIKTFDDVRLDNKKRECVCDGEKKAIFESEIKMKNVSFCYPTSNKFVLQNADMIIPAGSMVGIIGASGAGKTTVVDLLLGLLQQQDGKILVDEQNIQFRKNSWLKNVGYIPQNIFLLGDTIRANVAFGEEETQISDEMIWSALQKAELDDFVKGLPQKLDTQVGEKGICLSGGQKQRIGIARALYKNPSVLFFDEATSALDNDTESSIMESLNALRGSKTIIIIAHRLSTIEKCDLIYKVENQKIRLES